MTRKFELDDDQHTQLCEWVEKHRKTCPLMTAKTQPFCGSNFHYIFTPTTIGLMLIVNCTCGQEIDLTDYASM